MFWQVKILIDKIADEYNESISSDCYYSEIILDNFYKKLESVAYSCLIKLIFDNLNDEMIEKYQLVDVKDIKDNLNFKHENLIDNEASDLIKINFDRNKYAELKNNIINKSENFEKYFNDLEEEFDINNINIYLSNIKITFNPIKYISNDIVGKTKTYEEFIINQIPLLEISDNEIKNISKKVSEKIIDNSMKITDWDVWHCYSTFSCNDLNNLNEIAIDMVEKDIISIALSSDFEVFYKKDNEVHHFELEFSVFNMHELKFKFPDDLNAYQAEGLHQLSSMLYSEYKLFHNSSFRTYSFIKGLLSPIIMEQKQKRTSFYPHITLFSWGILNLSFRVLSPDFEYFVESFIENEINLSKHIIENICISPSWVKLCLNEQSFFYNEKHLEKLSDIENNIKNHKLGDFVFDFYSSDDLNLLIENFEDLIEFLKININDIIIGLNKNFDGFNGYWTIKPSIYILDFLNRPSNKNKMIEEFKGFFLKIITQLPDIKPEDYMNLFPKDLRNMDDYCLYITKGLFLWISCEKEKEYPQVDSNRGHLIYEKQVMVEVINNFNIQMHKLNEIASIIGFSNKNHKQILYEQSKILLLEELMSTKSFSSFGEIEEIINYCLKELQWNELKDITKTKLTINENSNRDNMNLKLQLIIIGLTFATLILPFVTLFSSFIKEFIIEFSVFILAVYCLLFIHYLNYIRKFEYFKYRIIYSEIVIKLISKYYILKDVICKKFKK
ncbi:MAG: hypothetical protein KO202_03930 [Methanobacteriaceae archaeon]|jgi:hypothetical protein|nr:hypothetical protein [Methanobacteriaceae archaeon]